MELISPEIAVDHIENSLDNSNANIWHDIEEDVTWVVRGRGNIIEFEFTDADDNEIIQKFMLVEVFE